MSNIFNLPEATGVSGNDYIYIASPTLGDRKIKAEKLVGGDPVLTTKNITQNGTYNASSDNAEGYSSVIVNVEAGVDLIGSGSDWQITKQENNASINFTNNKIVETWNGTFGNGGINVCRTVKIPASANEIVYRVTTGTYQGRNYGSDALYIGLYPNITTNWVLADDSNFLIKKTYDTNYQNKSILDILDLSNVNVDTYLYIGSVMWNWTFDKIRMF